MKLYDRTRKRSVRGIRTSGFSLLELLIVVFVVMVVAGIAIPNILSAVANVRLRASAGDLAGLMQDARILALRDSLRDPQRCKHRICRFEWKWQLRHR
jgi:Tfp pilus assembly protein FimT